MGFDTRALVLILTLEVLKGCRPGRAPRARSAGEGLLFSFFPHHPALSAAIVCLLCVGGEVFPLASGLFPSSVVLNRRLLFAGN